MDHSRASTSPSRPSSLRSASQSREADDHVETPLRKKARTDQGDMSPLRTAAQTLSPPPPPPRPTTPLRRSSEEDTTTDDIKPRPTPVLTPSKVTLNLRNSAGVSPPPRQPRPSREADLIYVPEDASHDSPTQSRGSLSSDTIEIAEPSPERSPEAIDITLDGDASDDDGAAPSTEDQLYSRFPGVSRQRNAQAAAEAMCQSLVNSTVIFDLAVLSELEAWFDYCVTLCDSSDTLREQIFTGFHQPFWACLVQFFAKLLNKRCSFEDRDHASHSVASSLDEVFMSWVRICGQMHMVDSARLRLATETASAQPPAFISGRALTFMQRLLNPSATFWTHLRERKVLYPEHWLEHFCARLIDEPLPYLAPLQEFATTVARALHIWQESAGRLLPLCFVILSSVGQLEAAAPSSSSVDDELSHVESQSMHTAQVWTALWDALKAKPEKSILPTSFYQDMFNHMKGWLRYTANVSDDTIVHLFAQHFPDVSLPQADSQRVLLLHLTVHDIVWHLLRKGRMELRVWAAKYYSDDLVLIHDLRRKESIPIGDDVVLQALAQNLEKQCFLEYIIGVDSHPQLLSRSGSIIAFLIVCRRWHDDMARLTCQAIETSQDRRLKHAILEMISGQPADCMSNPQRLRLCEQIAALSYSAIDGDTIDCLCNVVRGVFGPTEAADGETTISTAFSICRRLLRRSYSKEAQNHAHNEKVLAETTTLLHGLVRVPVGADLRLSLYNDCIEEIKSADGASAGSMQFMLVFLQSYLRDDGDRLFSSLELSSLVAENICIFIASAPTDQGDLILLWRALDIRMEFLSFCLEYDESFGIGNDLEKRLWTSVVGFGALSDAARDVAWRRFENLALKTHSKHAFLDRCIDQHLPELASELLTMTALMFVEQAIAYRLRVGVTERTSQGVVLIPLSDFLWRALLSSAHNVYQGATRILCHNYLDTGAICDAPDEAIKMAHVGFVETCVHNLKKAAAFMSVEATDINLLAAEPNECAPEIHFRRSLELLNMFLATAKLRPRFRRRQSTSLSPIDLTQATDLSEAVVLKFQAFGDDGKDSGMKELKVSKQTTFGDLKQEFCRKLKSDDASVIFRGERLDLEQRASEKAEQLALGGLLLVQYVRDKPDAADRSMCAAASSDAEETVLHHMDDLYAFLSMPHVISMPTREFMMQFPPHQRPLELVTDSNANRHMLLFPHDRLDLALYNITALRKELARANLVGVIDENWIVQANVVLSASIVSLPSLQSFPNDNPVVNLAYYIVDTMIVFLKERTDLNVDPFLADVSALVHCLLSFMVPNLGLSFAHLCMRSYVALVELTLHSARAWASFTSHPDSTTLHRKLLLEYADSSSYVRPVATIIGDVCSGIVASRPGISPADYTAFYWPQIQAAIPHTRDNQAQSGVLFDLASRVFPAFADLASEDHLRRLFKTWGNVLLSHRHIEVPGKDETNNFVLGMTRQLLQCLRYLKAYKKPTACEEMMTRICSQYLFPSLANASAEQSDEQCFSPVLDPVTRKELHELVLGLCESKEHLSTICSFLAEMGDDESRSNDTGVPAASEYRAMLRSPAGYVGLRNLTNTCYMNSLLSQLFMNAGFRQFFTGTLLADSSRMSKLLFATRYLFARMQTSYSKYEDTELFASAIKPYDADEIDITIQMDVDEFFNLLFDRWESQLPDEAARRRFRSFFGGKLVTQIKSLDCEHISERLEDCYTIQCEVKGKANLTESLMAYVQGDVMEGDNKYKCESCGGRFVNAIKRSCFKEVPDNVIFHLKRFDFDLITMQRSKINDRFEFPMGLDLAPFNVAHLSNPAVPVQPDIFELSGVLIHSGTAETGHYYSYIRDEERLMADHTHPWLAFNDTIVDAYDIGKLAEDSFGGDADDANGQWNWQKPNSAYMLFYKRQHAAGANIDLAQENDPLMPQLADTSQITLRDNSVLLRRACQVMPSHSIFLQRFLARLRDLNHGICSDDHELETKLLTAVIQYANYIGSRSKSLDELEDLLLNHLLKHVAPCSRCCMIAIKCLTGSEGILSSMLLTNSSPAVRATTRRLISNLLWKVKTEHPDQYGLHQDPTSAEELSEQGSVAAFPLVLQCLSRAIPHLGQWNRFWADFYDLITDLASWGLGEITLLLEQDIFLDLCTILAISTNMRIPPSRRHEENYLWLTRSKKASYVPLARPITAFLQHIDPFINPVVSAEDRRHTLDWSRKLFPLTLIEARLVLCGGRSGYIFFARFFDLIDYEEPDNSPQLAALEHITPLIMDSRELMQMATTIASSVREWHPWAVDPSLVMASTFCRFAEHADVAGPLIDATVENLETIDQLPSRDPDANRGGQGHLEFFKTLAQAQDFRCSDRRDYLQKMVVSQLHKWVPRVLCFATSSVRRNIVAWLQEALFDKMPHFGEDDEPDDLDIVRTEAVRRLFLACFLHVEEASKYRHPLSKVFHLIEVTKCCAAWTQHIHNGLERSISGYKSLWHQSDDSEILTLTEALSQLCFANEDADVVVDEDAFATETDDNIDSPEDFEEPQIVN